MFKTVSGISMFTSILYCAWNDIIFPKYFFPLQGKQWYKCEVKDDGSFEIISLAFTVCYSGN